MRKYISIIVILAAFSVLQFGCNSKPDPTSPTQSATDANGNLSQNPNNTFKGGPKTMNTTTMYINWWKSNAAITDGDSVHITDDGEGMGTVPSSSNSVWIMPEITNDENMQGAYLYPGSTVNFKAAQSYPSGTTFMYMINE